MSLVKIIVAASAGLAAGVVIGLLAAPMSGAETRQKIADGAEELKKKILNLKGEAEGKFNDYKDAFEESSDEVKKNFVAATN
ncbi:MAG: YtxH domain-containing protein [Pedobacter sp.]|nr:YtxH domain-containing protein [Chitinophagaceae bacterium]